MGQLVAHQPVAGGVLAQQHPRVQRDPDAGGARLGGGVVERHGEGDGVDLLGVAARQLLQRGQEAGVAERVDHDPALPRVGHHRADVGDAALHRGQQVARVHHAGGVEDAEHPGDLADLDRPAVPGLGEDAVALLPLRVGHRGQPQPVPCPGREEVPVACDDRRRVVPRQAEVHPHHHPVGVLDAQDVGGVEGVAEHLDRQLPQRAVVVGLLGAELPARVGEAAAEDPLTPLAHGDGPAAQDPLELVDDARRGRRRRGRCGGPGRVVAQQRAPAQPTQGERQHQGRQQQDLAAADRVSLPGPLSPAGQRRRGRAARRRPWPRRCRGRGAGR